MQQVTYTFHKRRHWSIMQVAALAEQEANYLRRIAAEMHPLSKRDYRAGPGILALEEEEPVYVLDGQHAFVCYEWTSSLVVFRAAPKVQLAWAVIRASENRLQRLFDSQWPGRQVVPAKRDEQSRFDRAMHLMEKWSRSILEPPLHSSLDESQEERRLQNLKEWSEEIVVWLE